LQSQEGAVTSSMFVATVHGELRDIARTIVEGGPLILTQPLLFILPLLTICYLLLGALARRRMANVVEVVVSVGRAQF